MRANRSNTFEPEMRRPYSRYFAVILLLFGVTGCDATAPPTANTDTGATDFATDSNKVVDASDVSDARDTHDDTATDVAVGNDSGNDTKTDMVDNEDYEQSLLTHRIGFGANITGGAGGELVVIDDLTDGSFEAAIEAEDPKWIRFSSGLTGTFNPTRKLFIGSNKTIDGRGANITWTNDTVAGDSETMEMVNQTNVIFHNIRFSDMGLKRDPNATGTNVSSGAILWAHGTNSKLWIDHCTYENIGDDPWPIYNTTEFLFTHNFTDKNYHNILIQGDNTSTIAMNVFSGENATGWAAGDGQSIRSPLIRGGQAHIVNNFVDFWGAYGMSLENSGEFIVDNNFFGESLRDIAPVRSNGGYICETNNVLEANVPMRSVRGGLTESEAFDCDNVFTLPYEYDPRTADAALKVEIFQKAGRSDNPEW